MRMKNLDLIGVLSLTFILLLVHPIGIFAQSESSSKTLSPYFLVTSKLSQLEQFPLKATAAEVKIVGTIADVRVTQTYKNQGSSVIEAVYVFPGSTEAAVYALEMRLGERVIKAKVKERSEAKATYEAAKKEGKSASLLEQHRPNVFRMSVANILPGDEISVELKYTEKLKPTDGIYEFVYPTVVGPRYVASTDTKAVGEVAPNVATPSTESWTANPYCGEGQPAPYGFDLSVALNAGMAIKEIATPSHKTSIQYDSESSANVRLDRSEVQAGNRDFVLRYRLSGDKIESGVLLYPGENESFFLATIQPPKKVTEHEILPREYIFVVDVSGSMFGFPLDVAKTLMRNLVESLRPTDLFNVLLFAGGSDLLSPQSLPATKENIGLAVRLIESQRGGGGTEILPALTRAFSLPRQPKFSRSVVVVTDGYVAVEDDVFDLIRKNLNTTNIFAFGIGTAVNRQLIEGMARVGGGEPFVVLNQLEAPSRAEAFKKMIQAPVLSSINLTYYDFDVYDVEPLSVPDVLAERPIQVFGKYHGVPRGRIVLTGDSSEGSYSQEFDLSKVNADPKNEAIKYLWARQRIKLLSDYNSINSDEERRREVIRLGITYNLLTQYTSFVAVDQVIRAKTPSTEVKQPLPLPQGVSNLAVGGVAPTVPEPSEWLVMFVISLMLIGAIYGQRRGACASH